ncbi:hypothetical protein [Acidovorax sp.]|uniref:hypothetical protein n=1 Tax=Acidovorax sp. TaxID=1872122 RepID=UPI00260A5CF5|nr:hypothetical protein [Acidovorax sp.]
MTVSRNQPKNTATTQKRLLAQPTRFAVCAAFLSIGNSSHRRHIHTLPKAATSKPAVTTPMDESPTPNTKPQIGVIQVNTPIPLDVLAST